MTFSICIPNYNYGRYLGATIASALEQTYGDLEVHVSDNDSTDDSLAVLEPIDDPRFSLRPQQLQRRLRPQPRSGGGRHQGRLDHPLVLGRPHEVRRAGDLPSDHRPGRRRRRPGGDLVHVRGHRRRTASPSGSTVRPTGAGGPTDIDTSLSTVIGATTYRMNPADVLRRSLTRMRNPVWFASTTYPRAIYDEIEGYRGQGLLQPGQGVPLASHRRRRLGGLHRQPPVLLPGPRLEPERPGGQQRRLEAAGRRVRALVQQRRARPAASRGDRPMSWRATSCARTSPSGPCWR